MTVKHMVNDILSRIATYWFSRNQMSAEERASKHVNLGRTEYLQGLRNSRYSNKANKIVA